MDIILLYYDLGMINDIILCWVPSHVDIAGNEKADKAAKAALDLHITRSMLPHSDFKCHAHSFIRSRWQQDWDEQTENKLHEVKPCLGPWPPIYDMSRRDQLVMARARIGHSYLTHGFLLRGEEPPMCVSCRDRLTVEHVLVHCTELSDIRDSHYECGSINDLFANTSIHCILNFLKESGLYPLF